MIEYKTYVLTLVNSGVFYIGSTSEINKRLQRHLRELRNNTHHNSRLQSAWIGEEEILINCFNFPTRKEAYDFEEFLIKKAFNSERRSLLANITLDSRFGDSLTNHPLREELIAKRVESQIKANRSLTEEERQMKYGKPGARNGMYGKTHTPEARAIISSRHKGHSYNKGIKLSEQHVEKIRIRQRLRTGPKNSFYGRHHSEETRRKLSEKHKGRPGYRCRPIFAGGLLFPSCHAAAVHFKITDGLVTHRLKKEKYTDWYYADGI